MIFQKEEKKKVERKRITPKTLILVALASLLVGIFVTARLDITEVSRAQNFWKESPGEREKQRPRASQAAPSFVELAQNLAPSVVNISTTQVVKERQMAPVPEFRTPFEDFFGGQDPFDLFGEQPREFKRQSLGSGFILNKDGYILTNNHVIENATEIIVTLSEGKKEHKAEVIGSDAKLDIALIKITTDEELPVAVIGDSDALKVGEWVLAIGNPFGLGGTVTAGIVSQKGRVIGAGPYDNFLQTDASINPGNSGGPLFNLSGEVVGINTAIIAGGQGIGFATPINMVKDVLIQLKDKGRVTRGWIGVSIQEVTAELAKSFGLKDTKGVLISSTVPGDPADVGGIKAGDVIVEFDDKPIAELSELPRTVAATAPGKKVKVKVIRDGKEKVLVVTVGEKPDEKEVARGDKEDKEGMPDKKLGFTVQPLTPAMSEKLGLKDTEGVLINAVNPDSPAGNAGLKRGDVIKEVNRRPVNDIAEYREAMKEASSEDAILLLVLRKDGTFYVALKTK